MTKRRWRFIKALMAHGNERNIGDTLMFFVGKDGNRTSYKDSRKDLRANPFRIKLVHDKGADNE